MAGAKIENVNVGIIGFSNRSGQQSRVVAVARDDKEITEVDVERVLQAARYCSSPGKGNYRRYPQSIYC